MSTPPIKGRLFVVTAPSGAGKTTLIKRLLAEHPQLAFSVSYTTRAPRTGEVHGRDYFFVSRAEFEDMIRADKLLEYARVFDNLYGTGREPVDRELGAGRNLVLDIDWQGAKQVRSRTPSRRSRLGDRSRCRSCRCTRPETNRSRGR